MSRSARLRTAELRSLFQLVGECRDLGDDPILWHGHYSRRLGEMTGAGMVIFGELHSGWGGNGPIVQHNVVWGDNHGFKLEPYVHLFEKCEKESMLFSPLYRAYLNVFREIDPGASLSASDLLSKADWYGSEYFQHYHSETCSDATVFCYRDVPREPHVKSGINLVRYTNEKDFSRRHKAIVKEAHAMIAPLLGQSLSRFTEPSPSSLAPRVRQVLVSLLEGDGDKQTATRLGISRYTVNFYTKQIFEHFGVHSRSELQARWIKRGWGGRFVWTSADSREARLLSTPDGFEKM